LLRTTTHLFFKENTFFQLFYVTYINTSLLFRA